MTFGAVELAGVSDDPVRQEIDGRSAGSADPVRQQRRGPPAMPSEMVDQRVWRGEDRGGEPEGERRHDEGTTTTTKIAGGGHTSSPRSTMAATSTACSAAAAARPASEGVLSDLLGGRARLVGTRSARRSDRLGSGHVVTFAPARARARPGECRVQSLVRVPAARNDRGRSRAASALKRPAPVRTTARLAPAAGGREALVDVRRDKRYRHVDGTEADDQQPAARCRSRRRTAR
jgi:hypothetical protein